MKPIYSPNILILTCLLMMLSACGFHLSGTGLQALQNSKIYIQSVNARKLTVAVQQQLQQINVITVPTISQADYIITLSDESYDTKVLSVSPATGKAQEYELTYSAKIKIAKVDATEAVIDQPISVTRDYIFDENLILTNTSAAMQLRQDATTQAARSVISQLNATIR